MTMEWGSLGRVATLACVLVLGGVSDARAAVRLQVVVSGLSSPIYATHAGDSRVFIVEQAGRIRIYDTATSSLLATPFLDIVSKVASGGERGLLSVAFHPDFTTNRLFYVNYTDLNGDTVIERYQVGSNANQADVASARRLLLIDQPEANHNGGQLQIGPDGHLYVGMGDGGGGGDPNCYAQRNDTLLGKLLRLNVRANLNTAPYYAIPSDNPYVGAADPTNQVPDEVWARGLRNPWRFSFDRGTGDLYIGDVGQNLYEEVDYVRAGTGSGRNYGWKPMEGLHCFSNASCPAGTPACNDPALTLPVFEYAHSSGGCSITGGYVSRGSRAPELAGRYVYGDYCTGSIQALRQVSGVWQNSTVIASGGNITSFGEGADGRLFVLLNDSMLELLSDPVVVAAVPALPRTWLGGLALVLVAFGVWLVRATARRAARAELSTP